MSVRELCPKSSQKKLSASSASITLINIQDDYDVENESSESIENLVNSSLSGDENGVEACSEILRYQKNTDRLLQLSSRLLKSATYHKAVGNTKSKSAKPLIDLPRTKFGKPYLLNLEEEISISHQYPYVAIAKAKTPIGIDIVVMEPLDLKYFDENFTEWEWSLINNHLEHFYIFWAMKEAYSKALGLGMSLKFSSFELQLPTHVTWEFIKSKTDGIGCKIEVKSHNRLSTWNFCFYPLDKFKTDACLCFCSEKEMTVELKNSTLKNLIQWHSGGPETKTYSFA